MKYTVITGASSGIGYEAALAFASRGKKFSTCSSKTRRIKRIKIEN